MFYRSKKSPQFFVTENGILIHNGANGAVIGAWIGRGVAWTGGVVAAAVMAAPAAVGGPFAFSAAWAVALGTMTPKIEATAKVTEIAGGIIGGVITSPV